MFIVLGQIYGGYISGSSRAVFFYKQAANIVSRKILKFRLPPVVHVDVCFSVPLKYFCLNIFSALCQFDRKN